MKDRLKHNQTKISKQMAYMLRHNPSGMDMSEEGFVDIGELFSRLQERWPGIDEQALQELVERDPKGRYEIRGGKIRARYGHSIPVKPTVEKADVDVLYHGTTPQATDKILKEGLKSKGRQMVHLSKTVEDAVDVGKRRTDNPVVLRVDVRRAQKEGVEIGRASDRVFVADYIPPEFVSRL